VKDFIQTEKRSIGFRPIESDRVATIELDINAVSVYTDIATVEYSDALA